MTLGWRIWQPCATFTSQPMTGMAPAVDTPPKLLPAAVAISLALHALIVAVMLGRSPFPEARHDAETSIDMPFAGMETEVALPVNSVVPAAAMRDTPPDRLESVAPQQSLSTLPPAQPGDLPPTLPPSAR